MGTPFFQSFRAPQPDPKKEEQESFVFAHPPKPQEHPELPFDLLKVEGKKDSGGAVGMPSPEIETDDDSVESEPILPADVLPARMLNEFVYCPRLFYYEHVEGVFQESADTEKGRELHGRVDSGNGKLPGPKRKKRKPVEEAPDPNGENKGAEQESPSGKEESVQIHSRSATLGSDRLGVVAKMDVVEVQMCPDVASTDGTARGNPGAIAVSVTPVDYKIGSPREGDEGKELWDTDKIQLGLQILVLRDNGYTCDSGIIYYRGTNQRVKLEMTAELERWIVSKISEAKEVVKGPIPPPLQGSPKCVRCSLAPVCLPDETRLLQEASQISDEAKIDGDSLSGREGVQSQLPPRRLMAARDDARALYLNTPGARVGRKDELLVVKQDENLLDQVRVGDVTHVALFGNVQISTQALQLLCEKEIPVAYFSMGGWFYGDRKSVV